MRAKPCRSCTGSNAHIPRARETLRMLTIAAHLALGGALVARALSDGPRNQAASGVPWRVNAAALGHESEPCRGLVRWQEQGQEIEASVGDTGPLVAQTLAQRHSMRDTLIDLQPLVKPCGARRTGLKHLSSSTAWDAGSFIGWNSSIIHRPDYLGVISESIGSTALETRFLKIFQPS